MNKAKAKLQLRDRSLEKFSHEQMEELMMKEEMVRREQLRKERQDKALNAHIKKEEERRSRSPQK